MARLCPRLALFALFVPACFDPTQPGGTAEDGAGSSSGETSGGGPGTTAATATTTAGGSDSSGGDPSGDPSTDPSGDPSTDPSGDPSTDPSGDPTTDPSGDPTTDPTSGPSDDSSSSAGDEDPTTDTGAPSCSGQCVPEVPVGWQGPVVINDGDDAPPCPGEFPSAVHTGQHTDLDEGSPSCTCQCGDVVGASCGSATLREEGNFCAVFIANPDTWVLSPNACTFVSAPAGDYTVIAPALQTGGASCSPQASESIPAPTWDRDVRSCGTAAGEACDGGTCLPDTPADHSLCIYAVGEAACPAGPWSQSVVTWSDVDDDRDCSTCTCGAPTGSCGGGAVLTNTGCGGGSVYIGEIGPGGCGDVSAFSHATWVPEIDASCNPSGGALQGDVTPTGAITYCCL